MLYLTQVRRQQGSFKDMLLRLRDGKFTIEDWNLLTITCYFDLMSKEKRDSFIDNECMHINETNAACDRVSRQRLMDLKSPIVLMNAIHVHCSDNTHSDDNFRRLRPRIYTAIGARMMLTWNISVNVGLVNGSIGNVIDIAYAENTAPPSLPAYIIMNMPNYSGPAFFHGEGRKHWVPILPQKFEFTISKGQKASRTQYPLQMAYSLTAHKAQGLTCSLKLPLLSRMKRKMLVLLMSNCQGVRTSITSVCSRL